MKLFILITFLFVSLNAFADYDKAAFEKACKAILTGDGACAKVEAGQGKRRACVEEKINKAPDTVPTECKDFMKTLKK